MHVTLTIEADSLSEISKYFLNQDTPPAPIAPTKPEATKKAESKKEVAAKEPDVLAETKPVNLEEVRAAVAEKAPTKRVEIKALLTKFGADKVTNLDKAKYDDFLSEIKSL